MTVFIYGTGLIAKHITYHLRDEIFVEGYIESYPNKKEYMGKKVFEPRILLTANYDKIIIASSNQDDILKILKDLGINECKIEANWNSLECDTNYDLRLAMMRTLAENLAERQIQGAVAELGVYRGGFSKYISRCFPSSTYYLFDTFEGFAEKDVIKDNNIGSYGENIVTNGLKFPDVEYVLSRLNNRENAIIKKGYFPETAIDVEDSFIFVLIDVDLYAPIYEGLKFFWPRMKKGGCIYVHDFGSEKWKGAKLSVKHFSEEYNVSYIPLADMGGSVIFVKSALYFSQL